MTELELSGQAYRVGKLDAMRQFHVSRRIAPIIPTLAPVFVKIAQDGSVTKDVSIVLHLLEPFGQALSDMSDEASEYVMSTCLSVVQRRTMQNTWAPVWSAQAKSCMFDDMDLSVLMQLALRVITDSLGPFIAGLLTSQQAAPEAQTAG